MFGPQHLAVQINSSYLGRAIAESIVKMLIDFGDFGGKRGVFLGWEASTKRLDHRGG